MKTSLRTLIGMVFLLGFAGTSSADLIVKDNYLVYDTVLNVTWLRDANYNANNGSGGLMTWNQAMEWANNLNIEGYTGWRLPTLRVLTLPVFPLPAVYNEMAYLDNVELGNPDTYNGGNGDPTTQNFSPFFNVQSTTYWTGFDEGPTDADPSVHLITDFNFHWGNQGNFWSTMQVFAMAVHDGELEAPSTGGGGGPDGGGGGDGGGSAVPEPSGLLLLGTGLLGLTSVMRKKLRM